MIVNFKKLAPEAVTPSYSKIGDAGVDLTAISVTYTPDFIEYGTGIAVEIPAGHVGLLFTRSSVTKKSMMLKNSVGVIDSNYRGEIKLRFAKINVEPILFFGDQFYYKGDRIGQLVIVPIPTIELVEKEELSDSNRGNGGFGSTGK
jgi:dUTP pyrophosphatase